MCLVLPLGHLSLLLLYFLIASLLVLVSCLSFVLFHHPRVSRPCCGNVMPLHTMCHSLFILDPIVTKSCFHWMVMYFRCYDFGSLQAALLQCKVFPIVRFFNKISESTLHFKYLVGNSLNVEINSNLQGVEFQRLGFCCYYVTTHLFSISNSPGTG